MSIQVNVSTTIYKPLNEVFRAIEDPKKITNYFVSHASDKLAEGKKITWEFKDYNVEIDVQVRTFIKNEKIVFDWEASGHKARVTMIFSEDGENTTKLDITEDSFESNEEGIKKALQQTQGWTDFGCSLKAYLYTGINLRTGKMN